jgi:hypothetical protein
MKKIISTKSKGVRKLPLMQIRQFLLSDKNFFTILSNLKSSTITQAKNNLKLKNNKSTRLPTNLLSAIILNLGPPIRLEPRILGGKLQNTIAPRTIHQRLYWGGKNLTAAILEIRQNFILKFYNELKANLNDRSTKAITIYDAYIDELIKARLNYKEPPVFRKFKKVVKKNGKKGKKGFLSKWARLLRFKKLKESKEWTSLNKYLKMTEGGLLMKTYRPYGNHLIRVQKYFMRYKAIYALLSLEKLYEKLPRRLKHNEE